MTDKIFIINNTNNINLCEQIAKKLKYQFIDIAQYTADQEMIDKNEMLNNYDPDFLHDICIYHLKNLIYTKPISQYSQKSNGNNQLSFLNNNKYLLLIPLFIEDWCISKFRQLNHILINDDNQYILPFSFDLVIRSDESINNIIDKIKNIGINNVESFIAKRQQSRYYFKQKFKTINNDINMIKYSRLGSMNVISNEAISTLFANNSLYQPMTKRDEKLVQNEIQQCKRYKHSESDEDNNITAYTVRLITNSHVEIKKYIFYTDMNRNIYSYKEIKNNILWNNITQSEDIYAYKKDDAYLIINQLSPLSTKNSNMSITSYKFTYIKDDIIKTYYIMTTSYMSEIYRDIVSEEYSKEELDFIFRDVHLTELFNAIFYVIGDYDTYLQYRNETEYILNYIHSNYFIRKL